MKDPPAAPGTGPPAGRGGRAAVVDCPVLATLTDRRFSDPGWVFEPKLDGERCLAFRKGPQVRLLSRNRKRLDDHYPELAEALAQEADDFVVDGGGGRLRARPQQLRPAAAADAARRS
jgi:bifunctional non-homologous end joining protein LigD